MRKPGKTGVLLINLGTPKSPSVWNVAKYLREFLSDYRVIDINAVGRFFLVHGIIMPFRSPKSAKVYQKLWTKEGSPLLVNGRKVQKLLQESLGENYGVHLAMRYQEPSIAKIAKEMEKYSYKKVVVLPLFPQYASSTTGSALEKAMREISKWCVIPEIRLISQYFDNEKFLDSWATIGQKYQPQNYDHVIFSYHGVPIRHLDKTYQGGKLCKEHFCHENWNDENCYCYEAACYATTRKIAEKLQIPKEKYTVAFQSRLGRDPWLEPYADKVVENLAQNGIKNLLVFSPAFTSDCLETTIEIGVEYREIFRKNGGENLQLVESLNDHPLWIETLKDLVTNSI